jgi:hypothetical protein
MAKDKKSFVMYCDQQSIFKMLPDEIAGRLIKHILAYVNDENPVTDDLVLQLAFEPIKMQLKRDLRHWDEVRGKRSESGKLGGRPKKQTEAKKANGFLEKQTKAKKAVNVNVNVTDNVNVNDNDNKDIYRKILHLEITRAEVDKLIADGYTIDQIDNILDRAENWKGIANKRSLYLTAKNWLSADIKKITAEVYRTPKENFLT